MLATPPTPGSTSKSQAHSRKAASKAQSKDPLFSLFAHSSHSAPRGPLSNSVLASSHPNPTPFTPQTPNVQSTSSRPPRLHLAVANPTQYTALPTHESIQQTWAAFDAMSDTQRNVLLKGLVARCEGKQVEAICTWLNLKMVDGSSAAPAEDETSFFHNGSVDPPTPPNLAPDGSFRHNNPVTFDAMGASHHPLGGGGHLSQANSTSLYSKLLSSHQDRDALVRQLLKSGTESARGFIHYLANRLTKLHHLLNIITLLSSEQDTDRAMSIFLTHLVSNLDARHGTVYLYDEQSDKLIVRASTWQPVGTSLPPTHIFSFTQLSKLEPVNAYNVRTSEHYTDNVHQTYAPASLDCILSAPLLHQESGKFAGIVELINKSSTIPVFESEDSQILSVVASLWTLLLKSHKMETEQTQQSADIRALLNTASVMTAEADLGDLIRVIMQTAQELLSAERCSLFLVDREKSELVTSVAQGTQEIRIPMSKGIAGHVAQSGQLLNIPNAYKDHRFNRAVDLKTGFKTRNILCIPMKSATGGGVIGVTQIINKMGGEAFTREDELVAMSFSGLAGGMLEKSLLFKALQHQLQTQVHERDVLQSTLDGIPYCVISLDAKGHLLSVNRPDILSLPVLSICQLTPYDDWLSPTPLSPDTTAFQSDIATCLKTGETLHAENVRLETHDGVRDVEYVVVANEDGCIVIVGVVSESWRGVKTLARYMSHATVRQTLQTEKYFTGTQVPMTVISFELRNFSSLLTTHEPKTLISLLSRYFQTTFTNLSSSTGILLNQSGAVLTGLFGIPGSASPGLEARRCVECAIRIKEEMNEEGMSVDISMGVASGVGIWGVVGSESRREISAVGDPITLSTAIQSLTSKYTPQTALYIDETTKDLIQDSFHLRELDVMPTTEKDGLVVVYEVLGGSQIELDKNLVTSLICYELGLSEYRSLNFTGALGHFRKAVQMTQDAASKTMVERCRKVVDGRVVVGEGWDGIWIWG
ncbi:GAF domain-like protein [Phlyctochytrium arcticum]|nr:GAF domain-like protein [Phlyctochytrium arcticum]